MRPWSAAGLRARIGRLATLVVLLAAQPQALAGPPYLTDDPDPVDWRQWEVYLANLYQRQDGASSGSLPLVEVNYGVAPQVELHTQIALDADYSGYGAGGHRGLSDAELGVEWRLVTETDRRPEVSVYPTLEIPTTQRGFSSSHAQLFLPLWAGKTIGRCSVYGGGGYWINPGRGNRNYAFMGIATEVVLISSWTAGGELYHSTRAGSDVPGQGGFNLGSTVDLSSHVEVLASAGHSLSGSPLFTSYVGARITF